MRKDSGEFETSRLRHESQLPLIAPTGAVLQPLHKHDKSTPRFASIALLKTWFPDVDPDDPATRGWAQRFTDRGTALIFIQLISVAVLIFNLSVTIYAQKHLGDNGQNFADILQPDKGWSCETVRQYNRWLHAAINALSTILLGASNYCAQLLVAPMRKDIDKAHSESRWLDIGVQSLRNLKNSKPKRQILWVSLMLSSALLHLSWNSAVFAATPFSTYEVGLVTADYLEDSIEWYNPLPIVAKIRENASTLDKIDRAECIRRYAGTSAGLPSVLIVSSNATMSNRKSNDVINPGSSLLANFTTIEGPGTDWGLNSDWMCSAWAPPGGSSPVACTEKFIATFADTWTLRLSPTVGIKPGDVYSEGGMKVDYCLVMDEGRSMESACALRVSPTILLIVTILNMFKCICIAWTAYLYRRDCRTPYNPGDSVEHMSSKTLLHLVTIGDAIASFLENEDGFTKDLDLATKATFLGKWPSERSGDSFPTPKPARWSQAASMSRWCSTMALCTGLLIIVAALLALTISSQRAQGVEVDIASLWSYGVGTARNWAVALTTVMRKLDQRAGFFFAMFFANMFQVVVSALYLLYNNLVTVMVVAAEWNGFISERKTLRLSSPRGIQRSNYFLSLPYRYSLALMICSGLLHWLISQSVFVIQTVAYTPEFQRDQNKDASSIGFSSIGIVFAMATGTILVLAIIIMGFCNEYKPKKSREWGDTPPYPMPLVSTCSAAISANCHRHEEDPDCSFLPVRWGRVEDSEAGKGGRYTFSTARDITY